MLRAQARQARPGVPFGLRVSAGKGANSKQFGEQFAGEDCLPERGGLGRVELLQGTGVAEMAVQSDVMEAAGPYDRAKALSAFKLGDTTFYWITRASAISVLLILGGIIISLIVGAWPAMKEYGLAFLS